MPTARPALRSRAAAWAIVVANQGLARSFAARLHRTHPEITTAIGGIGDVVQVATLGLLRAAELWDEARGVRFGTFAWSYMRGYVQGAYYRSDSIVYIPDHVQGERRARLKDAFKTLSLSVWSDSDRQFEPAAVDTEDAGGLGADELAALGAAVAALPRRLRNVVTWHYIDGLTLAEIGGRLGCTREWVRQLAEQGLARLRKALAGEEAAAS